MSNQDIELGHFSGQRDMPLEHKLSSLHLEEAVVRLDQVHTVYMICYFLAEFWRLRPIQMNSLQRSNAL